MKVAAILLLILEEEAAFWQMTSILEELLPAQYYTRSLLGVQADQQLLRELVAKALPRLSNLLYAHEIDLNLISIQWFMALFAGVLHIRVVLRLWDLFFYEGIAYFY